MAMNRIMTMAEKEIRDYAQRQMERAEQRENIVFTEKQKEQVLEYAAMTGDDYAIRKMVRNLADAVRSSDEEKVDEILWDARAIIDAFPDRSVGMAELKGYGYTADDMLPLRQEMALELHRVGEKVYCLQSDGSHGDYAIREMILEHEGLYGIEKDAWQRMQEQEDEIDFEEVGLYQPLMIDLDRDEALRMFNAGETVFLMTVIDLGEGKLGKYVRFTVNKEDNSPAKYSEIEIWATGKNFDESKPEYVAPESKYDTLVWSDEFNGDTVDETKWNIIDGMANHGAIYNRGAVSIKKDGENSYLAINSKNYETTEKLIEAVGWDQYQDQKLKDSVTWSSGRVESKDKFSFQFGRMAVRAKPNDSQGIWPAIWLLCQDETGHDEIDVLEYLGQEAWDAWTTNHFGILDENKASDGIVTKNYEAWCQDFHVFEVEWDPEIIKFFIDGVQVHSTTAGKDDGRDGMHTRPMFAILETQVGDGWVGPVDYTKQETKQDSDYLIDWVRVYQTADQPVARFDNLESISNGKNDRYYIAPESHTDGLMELYDGEESYESKDNFYYGGQPRYETSRVAVKEGATDQSLVYHIPEVKDVHLTTYYQTLEGVKEVTKPGDLKGKSMRSSLKDGADLDFKIYTSADGEDWTRFENVKIVDNFPEPNPSYARHTFDAYGLPEGTNYVKVEFPNYEGAEYTQKNGEVTKVKNTDIQLAKVTFLQEKGAAVPEPEPEVTLDSIKITQAPEKTEYVEGEIFDAKGMKVTAIYSDGTEKEVTEAVSYSKEPLQVTDKEIELSYTEKEVTKTVKQAITVKSKDIPNPDPDDGDNGEEPQKGEILNVKVSPDKAGESQEFTVKPSNPSKPSGSNKNPSGSSVKTGDEAQLALWGTVGLLAAGAILVLTIRKRKQN